MVARQSTLGKCEREWRLLLAQWVKVVLQMTMEGGLGW
jgi:hypothetical protein